MRKFLVLVSLAWVAVTVGAAFVSVDQEIPHQLSFLAAPGDPATVGEDWLYGWGTGLAAPLAAVAAGAVLAVLCSMEGAPGRFGAFLVTVLGGLSVAFTLANQVTFDVLEDTNAEPVQAGLIISTLALAGLMALLGLGTFLTAPRERYV